MSATVRRLPTLPEGRVYLAMVPHGWAKDESATVALRRAKGHGISRGKDLEYVVYDAPADVWVDGLGTIRWGNGEEELHELHRGTYSKRSW